MSCSLAFSVLITFPRNGRIAWNVRSRPCLAEPPAESPSTKYSSFLPHYVTELALIFQIESYYPFVFLPFRASSRALRAASRTCCARIALRTRELIILHFPLAHTKFAQTLHYLLQNEPHLSQACPLFVLQIVVSALEYEQIQWPLSLHEYLSPQGFILVL